MTTYDNVKFSKGGNILFVATSRVEENYINAVRVIKKPTTGSTPETPSLINLNKIEDRFTITGHINYGKIDATDTWTTAKDKKDGFKAMMNQGSTITMTYEGTDYTIAIEKFQITDVASDNTDSLDEEIVYDITITGVVGSDVI